MVIDLTYVESGRKLTAPFKNAETTANSCACLSKSRCDFLFIVT